MIKIASNYLGSTVVIYIFYFIYNLIRSQVLLHALKITSNIYLFSFLKANLFYNFWKLLFVVLTAIRSSGRSHVLHIMRLILSSTNYVRILNFTFRTILLYSYKRCHDENVGFWNSIQVKTLPYKSKFLEHFDGIAFLFWHGVKFNHSGYVYMHF